ncbi:MAG: sensor histidine kinase [Proteobacteria bacterium]|nr:sensor histidine kinase [Pseudomonadota bacterium]MBU1688704.1 sensor histidine kinase [Pseudomonadota bacterium]
MKRSLIRKLLMIFLLLLVIGIGVLHFITPGDLGVYHATYRRLSYFPIVIGAIWFGVWGGLILAVLSSFAFIPHLLLYIGDDPRIYLNELMEVILYLLAGTVTGFIASRESRLREKYRLLSEQLEESYDKLHQESALLLEVEEQLGASQKLSALGELSASLAHEIKNPLSSIRGTAEILLDDFPEHHPKREFVEILLKEVDRLNLTVNEILQYSRGQSPENGEVVLEPLADVLGRVGRLLETHLRKKSVTYQVNLEPSVEAFLVNGGKMTQVFLNIILNAIDVLPTMNGLIVVKAGTVDDGLNVTICDNGPGVTPGREREIFKPFVSDKPHGTGLGLSISSRIVESYGGRLGLSVSGLGGACFTIILPENRPGWTGLSDLKKNEVGSAVAPRAEKEEA